LHATFLALFAMICVACSSPSKPAPRAPPPQAVAGLRDPPPPLPQLQPADLAGPDEGCPPAFETCLTRAGANAVRVYLKDADAWMASSWILCGPAQPTPAHPP